MRSTRMDELADAVRNGLPRRPIIMGILNVTPDSFSDGGKYVDKETILARAHDMVRDGCGIIDVGGESTRPGATAISEEVELSRVLPVIEALNDQLNIPISIDTYKASVAKEACKSGATIVNDVWGLQGDPQMASVVADCAAGIIITHNRADIDPNLDILDDVSRFFERSIRIAEFAGIPRRDIILDPGIGFGKTLQQNLACITQIDRFEPFRLPILLGVSRKSFIGKILGNEPNERLVGTVVANLVGLQRGASIIRVHDVRPHWEAVKILEEMGSND